jgi:hypothetical protein
MGKAKGDRLEGRRSSPLVSEDGAPDVEPHALPRAPLHHLAAAASAAGYDGFGARVRGTAQPRGEETLEGGGGST